MRSLLLDLDGTLATTANVHKEAWEIALKRLGIRVEVNLDLLMGRKTLDIARVLGGDRYLELYNLKNEIYDELVGTKAFPLPCARELVKDARELGYSVAVVTSSLRRSAMRSLQAIGIEPDILVAGDDVERGKPDPLPVLTALRRLGSKPEKSIGVGDTVYDFQAFKGAGVAYVFIIKGELNLDNSSLVDQGGILVESPCDVDRFIRSVVFQ
ncbi:HAD-IA family hydrolase [Metallosphaera tengchongensis]|uniref:HAD-IA family hydrolase n=1 Tax=Metallosphaera tengchongensis TaxID=1532350 RepID=A0A6N0NYK6_9CREN|nr:HAD-IA family hydrolase [Metallosphaera tengchongensis]QKR00458.1 HAD-IA family hydrolase [Metallosphaera tengchongensis]